ncbi:uncharacterized protein axed isoform X2 [Eurosta solidaginis]|uniref:uncharacterized protein axed isoform X2 n=1 Tax=Eurosta solidaginis TaxID=178769 RepID=UPI003530989C
MVLPFGLASDGQNVAGNQNMITPTAPPAFLMHGHTNVSTVVPVIPSPYIDFIVVNGDDRYMIRCERKAVLENSVELAKLIRAGPNSGRKGDNHFQILNVDKNDFELVIRFLETKFVRYRDHLHILKILELADRFNCPDLVIHCIRELDLQLTSAVVIDIFRSLWFYQSISVPNQHQLGTVITSQDNFVNKKSKRKSTNPPPLTNTTSGSASGAGGDNTTDIHPNPFTAEEYGMALLNNSLQLIDMHAQLVLTKQQINELRFEELEMIAKRDALQLSSELVLFNCLADWSIAECQRKKLDPTAENRRRVLGPLCYAPRYLLMSMGEFRKACDRVELLDPVEVSLVSDAIEDP